MFQLLFYFFMSNSLKLLLLCLDRAQMQQAWPDRFFPALFTPVQPFLHTLFISSL